MKEVEFKGDLNNIHKTFKRIQNCDKLKRDLEKKAAEERNIKRDERWAVVKENHKSIRMDNRDTYKYLKEKDEKMNNLIHEIKAAIQEDIDQKKEIALLKKKDQMENLERGKNFNQLYKQKLVERILEKKERAERVKL